MLPPKIFSDHDGREGEPYAHRDVAVVQLLAGGPCAETRTTREEKTRKRRMVAINEIQRSEERVGKLNTKCRHLGETILGS